MSHGFEVSLRVDYPEELRVVAEAAGTLEDRYAHPMRAVATPTALHAESHLDAWRQVVGAGDPVVFERRLAWDGLTLHDVKQALACAADQQPPERTPSWLETFRRAFGGSRAEAALAFSGTVDDRVRDADRPQAFEELFVPAVRFAREQVRAGTGDAYARLNDDAHAMLERALFHRLVHICERALYVGFTAQRALMQVNPIHAIAGAAVTGPYATFVQRMRVGGLFDFFTEYPVAARLASTAIGLWIEVTRELVRRLDADLPQLQRMLGANGELGTVTEARADLGDTHDGGRSVVLLHFASGTRVVYKPRPIGVERVFAELVRWLNARDSRKPPLRTLRTLARPEYGWIEYAEHRPCEDAEGVARFYHRTGTLIALVYALNGWDFHLENLIASGEFPVLVDLEALLMPRFDRPRVNELYRGGQLRAVERHQSSVVRTGLLPWLMWSADQHRAIDLAGLSSTPDPDVTLELVRWRHINTDFMRLTTHRAKVDQATANVPRIGDVPCYVTDYVEHVIAGFRSTYRLLVAGRRELLAEGSVLDRLRPQRIRYLFRGTNLYVSLLERGFHPEHLRDGRDRSIQLEVLARPLVAGHDRPHMWPILRDERASLEQLDVPLFAARVGDRALLLPSGRQVDGFFQRSAWEEVVKRVSRLNEADLQFQSELIRTAFRANAARGLRPPVISHAPTRTGNEKPLGKGGPAGKEEDVNGYQARALTLAQGVATELERSAITAREGGASWIGIDYFARSRRHGVGPLSYALANGSGGIALFLAALAKVGGAEEHRSLSLAALWPLREVIDSLDEMAGSRRDTEIGIGTGWASATYVLARVGVLLGESRLIDDAQRIGALITGDVITRDADLDALTGSAGALLGLLHLCDVTKDERFLDQSITCARHLLGRRLEDDRTGARIWKRQGAGLTPGLAHGTAGIALALLRLHGATGSGEFLEAATEALEHEAKVVAERGESDNPGLDTGSWAYGAAGMALARLAAPDGSPAREGLESALRTTRAHLFTGGDDLAVGTMGRIGTLLTAGLELGEGELVSTARHAADLVARRASANGGFVLGWGEGVRHLGFFSGASGVAYELLRATCPHELASVLFWQ